jgi:hypothetical protein
MEQLIDNDHYNQMGDKTLTDVLSTNKGYSKIFSPENTKVILAPKERMRQGYGEFWPVSESGTKELPHPSPGKNVIEIYDPTLMTDQIRLQRHIEGELYHGMKDDPNFNKMREEFKVNYTPSETERIKSGNSWWSDANTDKNSNVDAAIHDAYIRGINDPSVQEGLQKGQLEYSPKQREILNKMQNYIKTGQ